MGRRAAAAILWPGAWPYAGRSATSWGCRSPSASPPPRCSPSWPTSWPRQIQPTGASLTWAPWPIRAPGWSSCRWRRSGGLAASSRAGAACAAPPTPASCGTWPAATCVARRGWWACAYSRNCGAIAACPWPWRRRPSAKPASAAASANRSRSWPSCARRSPPTSAAPPKNCAAKDSSPTP